MKKSISIVLLVTILLQSCVVYQKTPVTLNKATEKGKVKVVTNNGRRVIFNNIINEHGNYFGIYNYDRIPIDTTRTKSFYLRRPSYHHDKYYRIWVYLKNGDKSYPGKGYLYEVKDSSILISLSNPTKKKSEVDASIMELRINNIEKIKLRRINSVGRGALTGLTLGLLSAIPFINSGEVGYALIFFTVPITIIGALLGSTKKRYEVNGSIEQFSIYRHDLRDLAFIKQKE